MLQEIMWVIIWTLLPITELRASIPLGILIYGLPIWVVVLTAIIANILIAIVVYFVLDWLIKFIQRFPRIHAFYLRTVERVQKKIDKAVDRWGWIALAIFIGIPLPGSGVYTGALAGKIIGVDFKRFMISAIIGVLIAAAVVTALTLTGQGVASIFIKHI
ncbi:MAG: small multi-drug export protein [archaeon]